MGSNNELLGRTYKVLSSDGKEAPKRGAYMLLVDRWIYAEIPDASAQAIGGWGEVSRLLAEQSPKAA